MSWQIAATYWDSRAHTPKQLAKVRRFRLRMWDAAASIRFIAGKCDQRATFGFYRDPVLPTEIFAPTGGQVGNDLTHPWNIAEEIGPMCRCSMDCIAEKLNNVRINNPPYQVCPGPAQLNCTTFVTRLLNRCGFPLDSAIEPFQLPKRQGMKANPNRSCLKDKAGQYQC